MFRMKNMRGITEEEYNLLKSDSISTIPSCRSVFSTLRRDVIFNNQNLNQKIVAVGVWHGQNSSTITYEVARRDDCIIDIDRYFVSALSGGTANITGPIKDFPEHHSNKLPAWYDV